MAFLMTFVTLIAKEYSLQFEKKIMRFGKVPLLANLDRKGAYHSSPARESVRYLLGMI